MYYTCGYYEISQSTTECWTRKKLKQLEQDTGEWEDPEPYERACREERLKYENFQLSDDCDNCTREAAEK